MADRISTYRQVRLIITPGLYAAGKSWYGLHAMVVQRGIPHQRGIASGTLPYLPPDCTERQIREAVMHAALRLEKDS